MEHHAEVEDRQTTITFTESGTQPNAFFGYSYDYTGWGGTDFIRLLRKGKKDVLEVVVSLDNVVSKPEAIIKLLCTMPNIQPNVLDNHIEKYGARPLVLDEALYRLDAQAPILMRLLGFAPIMRAKYTDTTDFNRVCRAEGINLEKDRVYSSLFLAAGLDSILNHAYYRGLPGYLLLRAPGFVITSLIPLPDSLVDDGSLCELRYSYTGLTTHIFCKKNNMPKLIQLTEKMWTQMKCHAFDAASEGIIKDNAAGLSDMRRAFLEDIPEEVLKNLMPEDMV